MPDKSHVGMTQCFLCLEGKDVLLDRRLRKTLPRMGLYDMEPCRKCKGYMEQGIIIIAFDEGKTNFTDTLKLPNPEYANERSPMRRRHIDKTYDTKVPDFHRTGGWWVLKEEAVQRMADVMDEHGKKLVADAIKKRLLFLPQNVAEHFGLVVGEEADRRMKIRAGVKEKVDGATADNDSNAGG